MEDIRYHPLKGLAMETGAVTPPPPSLEKKDMEGYPFWLEEIVPGAFRLCSAEDITGSELEDTGLKCPNCGRVLKAVTRQHDGKVHAIYTCANCR